MTNEEILETAAKNAAHIVELETKLANAQAACAEMRELLDDATCSSLPFNNRLANWLDRCKHALSLDCGKGYISQEAAQAMTRAFLEKSWAQEACANGWMPPEKVKVLVEALTIIQNYYSGAGYIGGIAEDALAAVKGDMPQ